MRYREYGYADADVMIGIGVFAVLIVLFFAWYRANVTICHELEPTHILQSIQSAEEAYRAEEMEYLDVSESGLFFPQHATAWSQQFSSKRWRWENTGPDAARWEKLGVTMGSRVQYGYRVRAGKAGTVPVIPVGTVPPYWPKTPSSEPWYVVEACGNPYGEEENRYAVASSFSPHILLTNFK